MQTCGQDVRIDTLTKIGTSAREALSSKTKSVRLFGLEILIALMKRMRKYQVDVDDLLDNLHKHVFAPATKFASDTIWKEFNDPTKSKVSDAEVRLCMRLAGEATAKWNDASHCISAEKLRLLLLDAVRGGRKRIRDFGSLELLRIFCHRLHVPTPDDVFSLAPFVRDVFCDDCCAALSESGLHKTCKFLHKSVVGRVPLLFILVPLAALGASKPRQEAFQKILGQLVAAYGQKMKSAVDILVSFVVHFAANYDIYLAADMLDSEKIQNEVSKILGFFADSCIGTGKDASVERAVEILEICDSLAEFEDRARPGEPNMDSTRQLLRYIIEKKCPAVCREDVRRRQIVVPKVLQHRPQTSLGTRAIAPTPLPPAMIEDSMMMMHDEEEA